MLKIFTCIRKVGKLQKVPRENILQKIMVNDSSMFCKKLRHQQLEKNDPKIFYDIVIDKTRSSWISGYT